MLVSICQVTCMHRHQHCRPHMLHIYTLMQEDLWKARMMMTLHLTPKSQTKMMSQMEKMKNRTQQRWFCTCMHAYHVTIIRDISHAQSWKEEQPTVQSVEAKVEDTLKMEDPPTASPAAAGRNPYRCMFVCSSVAAGSGAFCTPPPVPSSILPRITSTHAYIYTYRGGSSVHFEQMCSKEPPLKNCRAQTSWQSS